MSKRPEVFKDQLSEAEWTVLEHISDILEQPLHNPIFMEELQLLKYKVRTEALNLTDKWSITEEDLEVENTFQDMVEEWVEDTKAYASDDEDYEWVDEPEQDYESSDVNSEDDWQEDQF
ncbi:hypothetical protein M422DRAFT_239251 [Sphaerobolus stellatus SS14]|nr:hypothetical protein M422DRAFT_239251 [Sphaerobolus stellatus SS14]